MADEPIGDEFTALPYCHLNPEHEDEFVRKGYLDARLSAGEGDVIGELKELISRILYVGRMEFSPFRADNLPTGWYAMNGQTFLDTSPQGVAILGTSQNFRDDWGIVHGTDYMVNIPNFLTDGKGYFVRAVDGTTRQVGSVEADAINIPAGTGKGTFSCAGDLNTPVTASGVFSVTGAQKYNYIDDQDGGGYGFYRRAISIDLSIGSTSDETRPVNIGMTPTIYLGV